MSRQDGSTPILFVAHAFSSHQPILVRHSPPLLRCGEKNTGRKPYESVMRLFSSSSSSTKTTVHQDTEEGDHHMQSFPAGGLQVWDGVFSPEVCQELHELAIDHSERTTGEEEDDYSDDDDDENEDEEEDDSLDGSSIFIHKRNGASREKCDRLTPLEQALDSFLTAYYDNTDDSNNSKDIVVEYWCRQEHLNLQAHADVDEVLFERYCNNNNNNNKSGSGSNSSSKDDNSGFRYPTTGHILYLTKPTLGLGPTCVFPPDNTSSNGMDDTNSCITETISSVVTIPAVPGRVLRFPGNALHAVPKPADIWFSDDKDDHEEEEEEDDDDDEDWDDEDEDDEERSVILFNTWEQTDDNDDNNNDVESVGPIGVMHDPMFKVESDLDIVDMMMSSVDISAEDSGVEIDEEFVQSMVRYAKEQKAKQLRDWREKYSEDSNRDNSNRNEEEEDDVVYSKLHCQPRESWAITPIDTTATGQDAVRESESKDTSTIRVPLMGDKIRRRYPKKAVRWDVPSTFQQGANDPKQPFVFPLKTK
jgi:hypothetical protein